MPLKHNPESFRDENSQKVYSPYIRLRIEYDMLDIELFKEGNIILCVLINYLKLRDEQVLYDF